MLTNNTFVTDDDDRTEQVNELLAQLVEIHERYGHVEERILASHLAAAQARLRTRDFLAEMLGEGQHQIGPWDVTISLNDDNWWVVEAVRA